MLDADIYGPSQPQMLGLSGRPESTDGKRIEPLQNYGIQAMSIGFLVDVDTPMVWRGPMVTGALEQLLRDTRWKDLDYLIIDLPPGTGDIQLTLSQKVPVTGAIIVTTPQDIALLDARKGLKMFEKVGIPILGIVENMSTHICSQCGHEEHILGQAAAQPCARITTWIYWAACRWILKSVNRPIAENQPSSPNRMARSPASTNKLRVPLPSNCRNWHKTIAASFRILSFRIPDLILPQFCRYIGIDYSGAETPDASLKGLRVYLAEVIQEPREILPPPGPRKYWTRRGLAEWLILRLSENIPTLIGIDHGFSFPLRYFEVHRILPDWPEFLEDFHRHWPTDGEHMYVDFIRNGSHGNGAERQGNTRWRRLAEIRCGAKSVFHFDVPGSVAKSTHAGLPWLHLIHRQCAQRVHFWPFDGWSVPPSTSVVAEAYPALWKHRYAQSDRTPDQHDAYSLAAGLRDADLNGQLESLFHPQMLPGELGQAQLEGWILGVS